MWAMPIALFLENWLKAEDGTSLKEREKLILTPPLIARNLSVRTLHEQLVIINFLKINQSLTMMAGHLIIKDPSLILVKQITTNAYIPHISHINSTEFHYIFKKTLILSWFGFWFGQLLFYLVDYTLICRVLSSTSCLCVFSHPFSCSPVMH